MATTAEPPAAHVHETTSGVDSPAPHTFKLHHFPEFTWCKFCTKFIWGLGKQGYQCKACKYAVHVKCLKLVPSNCPKQEVKDPNAKKSIVSRNRYQNMNDLIGAMKNPKTGVEVKDRKQLLKSYPNCFVGQEAVDWMLRNLPIRDRDDGLSLGQRLLTSGYIRHVSDNKKGFRDGEQYYVFEGMEKVEQAALASENITSSGEYESNNSGASLEDFEIVATIGKGGFGKVVKVKRRDNQKIYAMKIMNKTKISGQRQLQCLIAEKNIMLNDNPFLIHLYSSFQTPDKLYFVMDYIPGGDMAFHLEQKGRFSEKEARFFAAEIVLALEHLHSCGIVYRDLKLENILVDGHGHVCLTDFGLSKELDSVGATTKTVCGTPTYLAPEVLLGQPYGNAIDWWSLGVVLFELFTGMNPFDARDFDAVLNNILHCSIVIPDYVPSAARDLIEKLLQRNPQKRLCSGPTGSVEIQNHEFFSSTDWKKMMVKAVKPPYVPKGQDNFSPDLQDEGIEPPQGKGDGNINLGNDFTYVANNVLA
eukprot:TRINITY_DN10968_c0_g1_i1.p1 TRINITY_DN10968_c0_g1~~TRINITY_DN10968_c0_g1_i1.p1  ORF type:complete len:531 (-),score=159.02 TRINITY_DN10968_c0_g1_i1:65-1657(-)